MKITRAKLEDLVNQIVQRCKKSLDQAIKDAKLSKNYINKIILVGGPTRMPIVRKFVEDYFGRQAEGGVDPMECVAMGAAVQAGVLAGEVKDILLLDVTPLTLGIETLGGIRTPLIQRNTTIPTKKNQIFSTAADSQTSVEINVLQGEREMATDNKSLGRFILDGIPPAPRGIPQVEVTFDIDANGILHATAKDLATNKERSIKIIASQKLNEQEVERMRKEAEQYAEADKKKKESIETKNNADSLTYSTERLLNEYKDKIDSDLTEKIQKKLDELKEANKSDDIEDIKKKIEELNKITQEIGTKMYQEAMSKYKKENPESGMDKEKGNDEEPEVVDAEVIPEEEEPEKEKGKKKKKK